jgi:hypothetical protein
MSIARTTVYLPNVYHIHFIKLEKKYCIVESTYTHTREMNRDIESKLHAYMSERCLRDFTNKQRFTVELPDRQTQTFEPSYMYYNLLNTKLDLKLSPYTNTELTPRL